MCQFKAESRRRGKRERERERRGEVGKLDTRNLGESTMTFAFLENN